jgi:hypothetical protein
MRRKKRTKCVEKVERLFSAFSFQKRMAAVEPKAIHHRVLGVTLILSFFILHFSFFIPPPVE